MSVQLLPQSLELESVTDSLRLRMKAAGCEFYFTVRQCLTAAGSVDEVHHRSLLEALFSELQAMADRGWQWQMAKHPHLKAGQRSMGPEDVFNASAMPWDTVSVVEVCVAEPVCRTSPLRKSEPPNGFQRLSQAFQNPPSSLRCPPELFSEFCTVVGLLPDHDIEVLDWVGDPFMEPERSNWSKYFEDGKEWWGIWCLTVWNPRHQTLAALVASSTD
ncbi:hypothetical protein [Variovorax sp. UC74_104]|uniref:hypothetical protein n=1 Tax=Variovorax sp. UC74_104 TaxID=3374555 RepID=UPI0037568328